MLIFIITNSFLFQLTCIRGMNFASYIPYLREIQYFCKTQKVFLH